MTTDDFRRIALSLPGAEELNGLGYPNFCTGRKSFATIEDSKAVIRLTRDQQAAFVAAAPAVFEPVSNGWGRLGRTVIKLEVADEGTVQDALATAWRNVNDAAVNGLAGPGPSMFDFGLPFFFGHNVYVAIDGKSTPGGTGPYSAY